jgi:GNAT superfamily N-acetyltransferase
MKIDYRWMRPEDGVALARLHRRAILLEGVRAYSPDIARSWAFALEPEGYARSAARGEALEVALIQRAVVGFCGTQDGEISGLYVDPAFARRGVGAGLMRRALKRIAAEGHGEARVTAALGAAPFYEAMGFRALRGKIIETRGGLRMRTLEMVRPFGPSDLPPMGEVSAKPTKGAEVLGQWA